MKNIRKATFILFIVMFALSAVYMGLEAYKTYIVAEISNIAYAWPGFIGLLEVFIFTIYGIFVFINYINFMKNPTNRKFDKIEETYKRAFMAPLVPVIFFILDIARYKTYIIFHPVLFALYIVSMIGIFGIAISIKVLFSKDLALQENENAKTKANANEDITEELSRLKKLYDENNISKEEYELLKQKAINKTLEKNTETKTEVETTENNEEVNQ